MERYDVKPSHLQTIRESIIRKITNELEATEGTFDKELEVSPNLPEPLSEIHFYIYGNIERVKGIKGMYINDPDSVFCTLTIEPVRIWTEEGEEVYLDLDLSDMEREVITNLTEI